MADTYYDSELTGEQIEAALNAIDGVIDNANNGKVLAIENGKIVPKSVSEWIEPPNLETLNVTENGDYYPTGDVDGFDEVHVEVQTGSSGAEVDTSQLAFQVNTSITAHSYDSMTLSIIGNTSYEGTDIKISNLTVGKNYTLKFVIKHTVGGYSGTQYTYGFKISDSVASGYTQYQNWPNNLDRDNNSHVVYAEFTATSNTMYLSFNFSAIANSVTHTINISHIIITDLRLQSKNTQVNGLVTPDTGYFGLKDVRVMVSGGSDILIHDVSVITASDIVTEFECLLEVATGIAIGLQEAGSLYPVVFYRTGISNILFADLENTNTSATIYAVIRAKTNDGDYGGIVFCHNWSNRTAPMFYTRSGIWQTGVYGQDMSTGISSTVFRVLALAVNGTSKTVRYFIGDTKIRDDVTFTTSGQHASWGGGYNYQNTIQAANSFDVLYGSVVRGAETDAEIIANCQAIGAKYSSYIGT